MKKKPAKKTPAKKLGRPPKQKTVPEIDDPSANGISLLTIETGQSMPTRGGLLEYSEEYLKIKELLKKMKIGESFIIKDKWQSWILRILRNEELTIVTRVCKIEDNPKFYRVFRRK